MNTPPIRKLRKNKAEGPHRKTEHKRTLQKIQTGSTEKQDIIYLKPHLTPEYSDRINRETRYYLFKTPPYPGIFRQDLQDKQDFYLFKTPPYPGIFRQDLQDKQDFYLFKTPPQHDND